MKTNTKSSKPEPKKGILIYGVEVAYTNQLDLIGQALAIYSAVENLKASNVSAPKVRSEKYLRPRLIEVLTLYVCEGYSTETKEVIKETYPTINTQNLNQINAELTKKGYLVKDIYNDRIKHLNTELKSLRSYFLDGNYTNRPMFNVTFNEVK